MMNASPGYATRPILFVMPGLEPGAVQVAQSLDECGLLRKLLTPLALGERKWLSHVPAALRRRLSTRLLPASLARRTAYFALPELIRGLSGMVGLPETTRDRIWYWAETAFDRHAARDWAGRVPVIYGCEHASLETFQRHKRRGGTTILWQVIAHPRFLNRVICDELERFPETMTPFMRLWRANMNRSAARKERQFAHADLIMANSPFVRDTFLAAGFAPERVLCVPTGCPPVPAEAESNPPPSSPVTFVNAGGLSVRKGIHLLLDSWRKLRPGSGARLLLHGEMQLTRGHDNLPAGVSVGPRLPRPQLHALFRQASIFVLPTLAEGRANVVLEALANGLPVLTTPNSGCSDVIIEGQTGFLVPAGDTEALTEKLSWCLDHPHELAAMRENCRKVAASWQAADFRGEHAARIHSYLHSARGLNGKG
jgi:glycosyltransferase involved in cell wall biosynthesis